MALDQIYEDAGLNEDEVFMMESYLEGIEDFYGTPAYEKLYEYFCDTGEMPYGVAKARDGDPDYWIIEKLLEIREEET